MSKLVLALIIPFFLFGCTLGPTKEVHHPCDAKVVKLEIPKELLEPCIPEKPIEENKFLEMNIYQKEIYLTKYSVHLMKTLSNCNAKLETIGTMVNKK